MTIALIIFVSAIVGGSIGAAVALTIAGGARSAPMRGRNSEPEIVPISPTESRPVKSWPELIGSGNPEAHGYGDGLRDLRIGIEKS